MNDSQARVHPRAAPCKTTAFCALSHNSRKTVFTLQCYRDNFRVRGEGSFHVKTAQRFEKGVGSDFIYSEVCGLANKREQIPFSDASLADVKGGGAGGAHDFVYDGSSWK